MKEISLTLRYNQLEYNELSSQDRQLLTAAVEAACSAYAPYSHFKVGAAVLLDSGEVISGNNQENAAYPIGLCAERVALFYANATHPNERVTTLAITVVDDNNEVKNDVISPCGACRQALAETEMRFSQPIRILLFAKNQILEFQSVQTLLPLCFNQSDLNKPQNI